MVWNSFIVVARSRLIFLQRCRRLLLTVFVTLRTHAQARNNGSRLTSLSDNYYFSSYTSSVLSIFLQCFVL